MAEHSDKGKNSSKTLTRVYLHRLAFLIEKKYGTQAAFAAAIGVSRSFINHILMGRKQPSRILKIKIAKKLDADSREIWFEEDEND